MNSAVPFPLPFTSETDFNVTLETFRWLLVLGFPTAVAAATVWPEVFALSDQAEVPETTSAEAWHGLYPPIG